MLFASGWSRSSDQQRERFVQKKRLSPFVRLEIENGSDNVSLLACPAAPRRDSGPQ